MAEIFISYAPEDREQAERLAEEIRATGLTVWRSRDQASGDRQVLQEQIDEARAVIVLWTPASVRNRLVADEASEAEQQRKFVPIRIGDCRPPLGFRGYQHQDMSRWRGDGRAFEFKRLMVTLVAHARGQEAAEALPALESAEPIRLSAQAELPKAEPSFVGRWMRRIAVIGAIAGMIAAYRGWELQHVSGPYWAWAATLALSAVALFRAAEYAVPEGAKALVSRWLAGEKSFTSSEAFLTMFEGVFGRAHCSAFCLSRSVFATLAVYVAFLALFLDFSRLGAQMQAENAWKLNIAGEDWDLKRRIENSALLLIVIVPAVNLVADYVSLLQTRKVLQWSTSWLPLWIGVIFDAILTAAVFLALLPLGPAIAIFCADGQIGTGGDAIQYVAFSQAAFEQALAFTPEVWRGLWMIFEGHPLGEIDAVLAAEASLSTTTLLIALATTFITSVWLWFALLTAPLFWLIAAGGRRGAGWLGRITGATRRPILWLGYGAAALVLVACYGFKQGAQALRDPKLFRDCDKCPWMVDVPPGPFPLGTQFAEAGVEIARPFAIGVYETTFREWDACVKDGYCRPIDDDRGWGRGLRPVINVSRDDIAGAKAEDDGYRGFLAWMNSHAPQGYVYRLPSEAEWEYAARAGSSTAYWWGDEITTGRAVFNGSGKGSGGADFAGSDRGQTLPVGAFDPNSFRLYDVHGNVWEWGDDCWNDTLEGQPSDGAARRDGDCSTAVLRGGSWFLTAVYLRSAFRYWLRRNDRRDNIGFRLARTKLAR